MVKQHKEKFCIDSVAVEQLQFYLLYKLAVVLFQFLHVFKILFHDIFFFVVFFLYSMSVLFMSRKCFNVAKLFTTIPVKINDQVFCTHIQFILFSESSDNYRERDR